MYVWYVEINVYLLTYLLTYLINYFNVVGLYNHAWNFEPMHRVWDLASTGSKAFDLGDKAPEAGEYLSNKYEI